jgi:hypothetical protein
MRSRADDRSYDSISVTPVDNSGVLTNAAFKNRCGRS